MADNRLRPGAPGSPSAGCRRVVWHRAWGLCSALVGLVLVVLAGAGLATVPDLMDEERAFEAAVPCGSSAVAGADCLRPVGATVMRTVIQDVPKHEEFTLRLGGPPDVPHEIDMGASGPLLTRLQQGDRVTVTMWRDYATAVSRDGVTQESADTPVGEPVFVTALMLALLPCGAYALYAGGVALRRARRHAERGLPAFLLTRGKQACGAALCALPALLVGDVAGPWVAVAGWLAMLPLVLLAVRRLERSRGRHAAPPPTR
ncbi:hypothetical protein ACFXOM_16245 [Streptomyces sp. NPDC059169]|uniref:hypothetical protein n=1 Tax=Streptomyces sp. NPDC059169 TaxID=3346754 RepID=UPI003698869A